MRSAEGVRVLGKGAKERNSAKLKMLVHGDCQILLGILHWCSEENFALLP
jgi:hypothetical protein